MRRKLWIVVPMMAACSPDDGGMAPVHTPDPVAGEIAFRASCAPCHASGDAYDLAYFDFPDFDIVRRGVDHVDSATARDIAAYVRGLGVAPAAGDFRPFQPTGARALSDAAFWRATFGADGWPEGLTPDGLRALDLRRVAVPLAFPPWSSETDESDWMPERGLPEPLLGLDGGVLDAALDVYHASRTTDDLVSAIHVFQELTRTEDATADKLCAGGANAHVYPLDCFEARRWMSSLAAIHFIRLGLEEDVPFPVADLWWDTGEAAVTIYHGPGTLPAAAVAAWLYMSSTYAPDGFPGPFHMLAEDSGYMGQFMQRAGLERLAVLATLRRMVDRGPIHEANPAQSYWDHHLAVGRAPDELRAGVLLFGLRYLDAEAAAGRVPTGELADFALGMLRSTLTLPIFVNRPLDPEDRAEAEALADALTERISGG